MLNDKALDYSDFYFCTGIEIMNSKAHLTQEGLELIKTLSSGMNSKRTKFN